MTFVQKMYQVNWLPQKKIIKLWKNFFKTPLVFTNMQILIALKGTKTKQKQILTIFIRKKLFTYVLAKVSELKRFLKTKVIADFGEGCEKSSQNYLIELDKELHNVNNNTKVPSFRVGKTKKFLKKQVNLDMWEELWQSWER